MSRRTRGPWLGLLLLALPAPLPAGAEPADLVLRNAAVYTVDRVRSWADALAIAEGRIRYVGSDAGVAPFVGEGTRVVDLGGRMVLPGFQDAHVHPVQSGYVQDQCSLFELAGLEAVLAAVKACIEARPGEGWIRGGGWPLDLFLPTGLPDKKWLDELAPGRPVVLESSDGHTLWVNSAALRLAEIGPDTADPPGGRIDRYPGRREPSGSLQESAMGLMTARMPEPTDAELVQGLRRALALLNGFGVTAIQDAIVKFEGSDGYRSFPAYRALDDRGELSLRVVAAMMWDNQAPIDEQIPRFVEARERESRGRVRATSVKIWQDGVIEPATAALLEPYLDSKEGSRGELLNSPERLNRAVTLLDAHGFQVHFHAIGDRAIRTSLDAVAAARAANGVRDSRHHISHLELLDSADIPRFRELDVVANFQPLWAFADTYITDLTLPRIGPARSRWLYAMASVRDSGAVLAFGSDWFVSSANPLLGIETAVTRLGPLGETDRVFLPEERISLADAIAAYTIGSAYVNFLDRETGSIEGGKLADLVVLDRNLFAIPAAEISDARVVATLLDGQLVYGSLP